MSQAGIINVIDNNPTIPIDFEADTGFAVALFNIIRFVGAGTVTTSAAGNVVTITGTPTGAETLTGDTGGPLSPTANNFNIVGGSVAAGTTPMQVNGVLSTLTVNVQRTQAFASSAANRAGIGSFDSVSFTVDANGYVTLNSSALGVLTVSGTPNRISSTGGQNPVIDIDAAYVGQTSITTLGTITTGTWNASVIGLAYGGTNANLTASNGGIFYSTATAGAILAGTATANKVLMSGSTAAPVWSTPTYPNASATSGKMIVSDGTNFVASTPTFPNASASSGKFIISDGTNWIASTPTLPNSATGTGTLLRADGTNWVATTTTYPNTNPINTILYASSANVMSALATANNAVLGTNGSGVPSITTTPAVTSITLSGGTALSTYTSGGSWTPEIQFGGASVGITYAARTAVYSRIGNIVTFTLSIELSNKGSSTGTATITGLPFNPIATTIWAISSNALTFSGMVNARNPGAVSTISIDQWASGGSRSSLTESAFANTTFIQISGSYLA